MRIRILIKKAKFLSLESVLVCAEHFRLDILQAFSATQNPAESFECWRGEQDVVHHKTLLLIIL